jgi:histidinol-phosphatase
VGEERGGTLGSGRAWVLDPIDGTKNFLRGVPAWATLIALVEDGVPTVGVVSAPALGRRWWAASGQGAWTSDGTAARRISVSGVNDLADAYLSTTDLGSWVTYHSRERYLALVDACWETRAFGDFWQHCLVAEGALDLAAEPIVNTWDVAPVRVLIEEAGGTFTDLAGQPRIDGGSALSSNGHLHKAALDLLQLAG